MLDPSLSGPLGLVAEVREFREVGVEKIYHLLPEQLTTECTSIIYLIRPRMRLAEQIAFQIKAHEKSRGRSEPSRTRSFANSALTPVLKDGRSDLMAFKIFSTSIRRSAAVVSWKLSSFSAS